MNRRTKILASAFAAVLGCMVIARTVYPAWIKPLLTMDQRIAKRKADLAKLEALEMEIDRAKFEYRDFVERIGGFDSGQTEAAVRDRLNSLIDKYRLQNASVSPSRPVEDRKTGVQSTVITVTAVGPLESAVGFLKDTAELPELVRVANPAIYPASGGRKGSEKDLVNLRVPVEVWVLPTNEIVQRIDPAELKKPEQFVRHEERDYSPIWKGTPFTEFVPLAPLRAEVQRTVVSETGQPASLGVTPSGGDGNFTIVWTPAEGIEDPHSAHPTLDTSKARTANYTVTVADGAGSKPATATVAVTIRDPKPQEQTPIQPPPPPVVVDRGPQRWPDGKSMQIVMALLRTADAKRTNELMVVNARKQETNYYKPGDEFDGGKLVLVHPTGGLVHRKNQFFVYPLGGSMEDSLEASAALDYPELKSAAERAEAVQQARIAEEPAKPEAEQHAKEDAEAANQGTVGPPQNQLPAPPTPLIAQPDSEPQPSDPAPPVPEESSKPAIDPGPTDVPPKRVRPSRSKPPANAGRQTRTPENQPAPESAESERDVPNNAPQGEKSGSPAPKPEEVQPSPNPPETQPDAAGQKKEETQKKPLLQRPSRARKPPSTDKTPGRI